MADQTLALDVREAQTARRPALSSCPPRYFDVKTNIPLIHQVVVAQRAAAASGNPLDQASR